MIDLTLAPPAPVIAAAQTLADELRAKHPCPRGTLDRLYGHWAVAAHGATFPDYNVMIIERNGHFSLVITHDPADNARGVNDNAPASHTWHRNTGALGISVDGMDGATVTDFGPDGVTQQSAWYLCAAIAACALAYGIDLSGVVPAPGSNHADNNGANVNTAGEPSFLTHGVCALYDAYPSERWDWGTPNPLASESALTPELRRKTSAQIAACAHLIKCILH